MKTASSDVKHHPSLVNWTWPFQPRRRSYLPRKGYAPLVVEGPGFVKLIHESIEKIWNSSDTHLILGTEELDRFGTTPWSGRDGLKAIRGVYNLTRPSHMEVVVNYRRPRRDQWISIWKQLTRSNPIPYAQFLCDPSEYLRIWEYLDSVANPLGLARALLEDGWNVDLMDMQGISAHELDVAHVIACEVLQIACDNDWVRGMEKPILQNQKSGNPELSEAQQDDIERILSQRDCGYRDFLLNHPQFQVYHQESMWDDCDHSQNIFVNTTILLDLLQNQMGCGKGNRTIREWRDEIQKKKIGGKQPVLNKNKQLGSRQKIASINQRRPANVEIIQSHSDDMTQALKMQLVFLFILFLFAGTFLMKHLRCKGFSSRRLAERHSLTSRRK